MSKLLGRNKGCKGKNLFMAFNRVPRWQWHRVNSIISGRNPPLYCTLTLIAICRDIKTEAKNTMNLDSAQICYSGSGIVWVSTLNIFSRLLPLKQITD